MSGRELLVLGSSAQTPTRTRNHNGYLLRWDREVLLFDPGEGTQRQLTFAGASAAKITRICITHFHGDHCLGLPGILHRLALDGVRHPVSAYFPAAGAEHFAHLRASAAFSEVTPLVVRPSVGGVVDTTPAFTLHARELDHRIPTLGWRLEEPEQRHLLADRLTALGLAGPVVGRLRREGAVTVGERTVALEEVSEVRRGQRFAFVMDTALCDAAFELAQDADLLVCEATFLSADEHLAREYQHLTAAQAARIAAESGARRLVLTHFSQRYADGAQFLAEARAIFDDVIVAEDLQRVAVPRHA